jgi:DNA-binding transcriptional ArsR family regulator
VFERATVLREVNLGLDADVDVSAVARVLADPARVRFLLELGEGRQRAAGELATLAGLSPSAASFHLARLTDAGLLRISERGRHRYYEIASPAVARALEAMAVLAPLAPVRSLRQSRAGQATRFARICDGHLGGHVGVALLRAMLAHGLLVEVTAGCTVTPAGTRQLRELGLGLSTASDPAGTAEGVYAPCHPDWSENAHHLAGPLAAALTRRLLELEWISHRPSGRAVRLTPAGRTGLRDHFGIDLAG